MVDIWNHKPSKTFKGLPGEDNKLESLANEECDIHHYRYIIYLEEYLLFFTKWKNEKFDGSMYEISLYSKDSIQFFLLYSIWAEWCCWYDSNEQEDDS